MRRARRRRRVAGVLPAAPRSGHPPSAHSPRDCDSHTAASFRDRALAQRKPGSYAGTPSWTDALPGRPLRGRWPAARASVCVRARAASIPVVGFNAVLTSEHFASFLVFGILHAALAISYIKARAPAPPAAR